MAARKNQFRQRNQFQQKYHGGWQKPPAPLSPDEFLKAMRDNRDPEARRRLCMDFLPYRICSISKLEEDTITIKASLEGQKNEEDGHEFWNVQLDRSLEGQKNEEDGHEFWNVQLDRYGTSRLWLNRTSPCEKCRGVGRHPDIMKSKDDWASIGDIISSPFVTCTEPGCVEGEVETSQCWELECETKPVHDTLPDFDFS